MWAELVLRQYLGTPWVKDLSFYYFGASSPSPREAWHRVATGKSLDNWGRNLNSGTVCGMANFTVIISLGPQDNALFSLTLYSNIISDLQKSGSRVQRIPVFWSPRFPKCLHIQPHLLHPFPVFSVCFHPHFTTKLIVGGNRLWAGFFLIFILIRTIMNIYWAPTTCQALFMYLTACISDPTRWGLSSSPLRHSAPSTWLKVSWLVSSGVGSTQMYVVWWKRGKREGWFKNAENRVGAQSGRPRGQKTQATHTQSETSAVSGRNWVQTQRCHDGAKEDFVYMREPQHCPAWICTPLTYLFQVSYPQSSPTKLAFRRFLHHVKLVPTPGPLHLPLLISKLVSTTLPPPSSSGWKLKHVLLREEIRAWKVPLCFTFFLVPLVTWNTSFISCFPLPSGFKAFIVPSD